MEIGIFFIVLHLLWHESNGDKEQKHIEHIPFNQRVSKSDDVKIIVEGWIIWRRQKSNLIMLPVMIG